MVSEGGACEVTGWRHPSPREFSIVLLGIMPAGGQRSDDGDGPVVHAVSTGVNQVMQWANQQNSKCPRFYLTWLPAGLTSNM